MLGGEARIYLSIMRRAQRKEQPMTTYPNRMSVPYGLYLSWTPFDLRFVGSEGEQLDGREGARYHRVPAALVLLLSPVLGGAFVVAFPVIVVAALFVAASELLTAAVQPVAQTQVPLVRMRWEPAASYLNRNGKEGKADDEQRDPELDELEAEVEARREDERGDN